MKKLKKVISVILIFALMGMLTACNGSKGKEVVIYSNADEEAMVAMKNALDNNGYKGKYILQSFGTSELGGKLMAEGTKVEADLVTMSSFYLESAQESNKMFSELSFDTKKIKETPSYYAPITALEGAIIVNTTVLKENNLNMPASIKELSDLKWKDLISVTDIAGSSTGWLLVQAIMNQYGEEEGSKILSGIYKNAGPHLETSGSGPIKKIRAGEVAIGFGLRHQAVADKKKGLPIDFTDPTEGNFSLTESVAVINKESDRKEMAMRMAECIIKNARAEIIKTYPIALYEGEEVDKDNVSTYPKEYKERLTVDLLKKHQEISENCK